MERFNGTRLGWLGLCICAALLSAVRPAAATDFDGTLELMGAGYNATNFTKLDDTSSFIWWRLIRQANPSATGTQWHKMRENGNWTRQFGAYTGTTIDPTDNYIISTTIDAGGSGWSPSDWGEPGDININVQNSKSYVFNFTDNQGFVVAPGNDIGAFAVLEINHQNALVNFGVQLTTTQTASRVYLNANSSAESSGSNEELWFQWTVNDFSTRNYILISNIVTNTTAELVITNQAAPGAELKWLVMSTVPGATTTTIDNTSSGVRNFDAIAINKSAVQTWFVRPSYRGEIVDEFMYSAGATLNNSTNGNGWTNGWVESNSGAFTGSAGSFGNVTGYPTNLGNKITVNPAAGTTRTARRGFPAVTHGRLYVAYHFNHTTSGADRWAGLALMDGTTERAFVGETFTGNQLLGVTVTNGTINSVYGLTAGAGNDYTIIGYYDFLRGEFRAKAYYKTDTIPTGEPTTWDVTYVLGSGITRIDGIQLTAGGTGAATPGATFFDEVRVGHSWGDIVMQPTFQWDAGGGATDRDWSTAVNWSDNREPIATNNAFIGFSMTGVVSQAGELAADLFIGNTNNGTLLQTGGSLTVTNFTLGHAAGGAGVYEMSGGAMTARVNMIVGASGAGTAIVHGASSVVAVQGNLHIGMSNSINRAVFLHNAGTVTAVTVSIGELSATEGRYTMTGGALSASTQIYMGNGNVNSTGRLEVTGGRVDAPNIFVGRNGLGLMTVGGTATVSVNGVNADIVVGDLSSNNRTNTLFVNSGTVTVGDNIELGNAANSFGRMIMSGGTMIVTGQVLVGDNASSTGDVVMTGGNVSTLESLLIGSLGVGQFAVHGGAWTSTFIRLSDAIGGSTLTVGNGVLAAQGTGDFEIDFSGTAAVTGGVLQAHDFDLGIQPGALARLNVSGGTVLASNFFNIGFAIGATGIVELTGGAITVRTTGATTEIGTTIGSHGYLILSNGNFTTEDHVRLGTAGGTGTGVLQVIGGGSSILIGDGSTEDFTMGSQAADLRVTFVGAALSPIRVQDDIALAGNLTISNIGTLAAGTYVIATSLNGSAISGTFAATNWMGNFTGTISYANAAVTLTVAIPLEIGVLGTNLAEIADGDNTPARADGTDFGPVHVSGAFVDHTFQITNSGGGSLTISSVTTSGTHAADFSVLSFPTTVSGNSSSNLVIRFDPSALGTRTATITIANDDADEASYDFVVQGTGVAANVAVLGLSLTEIADGDTTPAAGDGTDFGTVGLVGSTLIRTFTITNTGSDALGFGTVSVSGTHAADFTVTTQPSGSPLSPGATTTFQVTFDPSALGLRTAALSFTNTAGFYSKDPYNFDIQGTGAGAGISNRPGSFAVSTMMGQNPADVTFSITNVGLGTLNYTLTTNNGAWLTARPGSAALAAGAGQIVTVSVSVVGLNAGVSNATINVIDASATNSPQTVTYELTITNVPGATAVSAAPEGAEMVRLAWTKPTGYDVMIVHRATNAPASPAQAAAYAVGDDIGGGSRVIYKGAAAALEHIVRPGSTNHYAFYGFTGNNYYSPAASVSATTSVYKAFEIVEPFSYTNGVGLQTLAGGNGWTNAWTISVPRTNTDAVVTNTEFSTFLDAWPSEAGNRFVFRTTNSSTYAAFRGFNAVTSGRIYVAALYRRQFDEGASDGKFSGLSFFDGTTERTFVGERGGTGNDDIFGVSVSGQGSTTGAANSFINGKDFLIIGRYDFDTGIMSGIYFTNDVAIPVVEPSFPVSATAAVARIDGIRLAAGASSGWNGEVHFDEVRVATNWLELMRRDSSYPFVTNFVVNGGSDVTDAQMTSGAFNVVAHIRDAAGVETTNTVSPMFIPNFDILSNDGTPVQLVTDRVFQAFGRIDGGLTVVATSTTHATIPVSEVVLGVHTVRVSAANSNGLATIDVRTNSAGATLSFTVVDDDTTAPVIGTFVGQGRALASAIYTNDEFIGGFWVTGTVSDAFSGLFAASNTFTLTRNGVSVSNGTFAVDFANGGATVSGRASNSFPQVDMLAGAYTLTVFAVDFDIDRAGDQLQSSATFSFTVVDPPPAPGLAVGPLTLTYSAMLGSSPAEQTFAVTNIGSGTLNYTNYQTYGPGASGWFSADLTNHALLTAASRIHTGRVSSATFNAIGTYIATNRVDGNQTNAAQEIVVTLNVTNIPSPTAASATPSGAEHVALRATESSGRQILIVHRETNAPSADPANGTPYSVGGSIGGGTVIYKGTAGYLDHVVRVGSTNFYALYTINNDRYSTGVVLGATVTVYRAGEIVEPFSYTNGVALTGLNGGSGFTNVWTTNSALASANQFIVSTQQFTTIAGYPTAAGNIVTSQNAGVFRSFAPVSSGRIYVSFMMRTDNGGGSQYSGLSFYSDGTEEKFVGEGFSQVNQLTVGAATGPTGHQLANNTDYTIIVRYDYDTDVFSALLYTNGTETVPTFEPATWDVTESDATVGNINRIRLESNVGVRWDEVRVATSWEDLLDRSATYEWDAGAGSGNRSWSTAANWTRDTEPGIGNSAFINNAYTGVVSAAGERAGELHVGSTNMPSNGLNFTGRLEQIGGDLVIGTNMYLGRWMGAIGTFVTTNGSLSVSNNLLVGDHGRGLMTVTGAASVWVGSDLSVGNSSAASETNGSTLTIGGGSVFVGDELRLGGTGGSGNGADGTVNMFGGLLQVTNAVIIGDHGSSTGLFVLAGGRLNALGELVIVDSASGQGIFRQGGGTADVAGIIRIGDSTTSDSQLIVSGGVFNAANTINVGDNSAARGTVTISGGVFNANGSFDVGFTANSTGSLTVAAGILNAPSGIRIGVSGAGAMTISGGSVTANTFRLADLAGSTGSLLVTGGRLAVTNTATTAFIFDQDNPIMTQSGGTVEITGGMELGDVAGAQGTIFLSGGTLLVGGGAGASQDLQLGDTAGGTGVVYLTGGFLDLNRSGIDLRLGDATPSRGIFAMNVGTASVGNIIYVGSAASAAGELYVTGGVLEAVSDLLLASGTDSTGRVVQTGGRVAAGGNIEVTTSTGANGYYEISGGTLTNGGSLTVGRADALGTGVFHIVGGTPVIHVGDSTTEDFRIQNSGELRLTFSGSAIAPVRVSDDIVLSAGSTLTITNIGVISAGGHLVATSLNGSAVSGTFSATNWLGAYTGTVSYANNRILITFDTPAEIAVLGTNLAEIASGDATPSVDDGTDYGAVAVNGATLDRTFYITNSGTLNLTISSVSTSGAAAADFSILSWPGTVSPLSVSNFVIRFDPSAVGTRTATITINNNDVDEGTYTFDVQGTGSAPNLVVAPLTLTFNAMLGSSPAASQTFTVSNNTTIGTLFYTNYQTYGAGASGWLDVNFTNFNIAAAGSRIHTALVSSAAINSIGVYTATNRVDGNQTNAAQEIVVTLNVTNIPAPTSVAVTNDGAELMRLRAAEASGRQILIVHSYTNTLSVQPTNGTAYAVNDPLGNGRVIFKFTGSASVTNLEHVVVPGTTNFYSFYTINNDRYSTAAVASVTADVYRISLTDPFPYTNGVSLEAASGGTGWTNAWIESSPGAYTVNQGEFTQATGYPSEKANRVSVTPPSPGARTARRHFPAVTNGVLYFSTYVRYQFGEAGGGADGKYAGISLMDGTTERVFIGEVGALDAAAGIDVLGNGTSVNMGANSMAAGTDYLLIGRYSFDSGNMRLLLYTNSSATVPANLPAHWSRTTTVSTLFTSIDGIRLGAGAANGTPGIVQYDEVRIATNWAELLRADVAAPVATNYSINGGVNVTDAQITGGAYAVTFHLRSGAGVNSTNTQVFYFQPDYDILNPSGVQLLTNRVFSSFTHLDGGLTLLASNATHNPAGFSFDVVLGVYTARWSAISSNGSAALNITSLSNGTAQAFTVVDDDTNAPFTSLFDIPTGLVATNLNPGDIVITGYASDNPDSISFVPLVNVPTNLTITFDDDGVAGNALGAGYVTYTPPAGGLPAGTTVIITGLHSASFGVQAGGGSLTRDAGYDLLNAAEGVLVWGSSTNNPIFYLRRDGSTTYPGLSVGAGTIADLADLDNGALTNTQRTASQAALLSLVANVANWTQSDAPIADFNVSPYNDAFVVTGNRIMRQLEATALELGSWSFTGLVRDVASGLNSNGTVVSDAENNVSPHFAILNSTGTVIIASQAFTQRPAQGSGSATAVALGTATVTNAVPMASLPQGVYTALVYAADADADRPGDRMVATNVYTFEVIASMQPGLGVGPLALTYHVMLGSTASNQTFAVTNIGGVLAYTNYQTYGAGASGWFSADPTNLTLAILQSRIHTGRVNAATFMAAGTYTATNRVDGNQTNAAQEVVVTAVVTNIPAPTSVTATNDGAELMRLTAAEAAGRQVLVVHSYTNALTVSPTNGTAYSAGALLGNGRVIFKFTGSASVTNLEHVVVPGSTNFYTFYTINNDYYSTAVVAGVTASVYQAYEIVEQFGYTNAVGLLGLGGGQGWTNAWSISVPATNVDAVVDAVNFSTFLDFWPAEKGNRFVFKTTNEATYAAFRGITPVTNGRLYVAALYRREFNEGADGKFSGISFFDGGTERGYVGERGGTSNDDIFGVSVNGIGATNGAPNSFPAARDYLIIGRYDFASGVMAGIYYTNNTAIPEVEPTFIVSATSAVSRIDRIRLASGADSGWNGQVFFDELRVATNWSELLLRDKHLPYATNYLINGGVDVTDAQVTGGAFGVRFHLRSQLGVESTNTVAPFFVPNFDILNASGVQIVTDRVFSTFAYLDAGLTLLASNATHASVDSSGVVLGVYTARWSAVSSNGNATVNQASLSNGAAQAFTVVDDDTAAPTTMNINSPESAASRAMHVSTGGVAVAAVGGTSGTNITYRVSDAWLASGVSGGSPLVFYFGARDAGSGLSRGTTDAAAQSSLTIGSAVISNVAQWSSTLSSAFADTFAASATNAWSFTSAFSASQIENLLTNATWGSAGSNRVTLTWRDADADRANDRSTLENEQHGWLGVFDDDTTPPTIQNVRIFGAEGSYTVRVDELSFGVGWAITGRVSDAGSGVNVNGSISNQPDNSPYFELWDSVGALRFRKAFDTLGFVDGGATTLSAISNGAAVVSGVTFADVGVWTARVIVADNDEDYGNNDHAIGTNEVSFTVTLGATLGGIGRYPASFAVTSSFGTVTSTNPWPQFFVTNIGSGALNYNATISYSGAGGWLTVAPTSAILIGNGSSAIHTSAVDASSLSPGTYSATITLNGDQTNAAQTITVNLRVFGYYPGEIVDQFTNSTGTLHTNIGGTGWAGTWSNNPNTGFSYDSGNLTIPGNYPAAVGNKVCGNTAGDTELQTFRYFGTTFTTGELFMAVAVRKSDGNADGFNGISFMSNGTEVAFAGKLFGSGSFGIDLLGNGGSVASAFGVNGAGDPGYFYIGKYDFETDIFYGRAYNNSDTLPLTEPSTWSATNTPTSPIGAINGIRIAARNEGTFCFDELRVSPTWEGLLNLFTNEPNVHASGINFRDVTTNAMVVGWTPGNGANRIVIAREGAAVTFSPTDNVAQAFNNNYTLAADLGSGNKVVYNGGGTNFTLTGLTETTRYFFAIYEYNGSPPNYYTNAGFATGSRWTLASEPASNATAFAAYTVSDSSISNTWTAADGSPAADGYLILRSYDAVTNLPADGVAYTNGQIVGASVAAVVTPGSAVTYLHTGLASCSNYHFRIFSFRWNGSADETYNYRTNFTQTATAETECTAPSIQASNIVFSLTGTNRISLSWQRGNGQGNLLVVRGTNAVSVDPADGTTYTANLNYGSGSHLGDGNYVVLIGTGTTATVTGLVPSVTYHFRVYEYNGSGSGIDYNTNTAVNNPRSTATASIGLVYEPFDYGSFENMSGKSGGTGWTNNWSTAGGLVETGAGDYPDFGAYPPDTPAPTRSGFIDLGNASEDGSGQRSARRHFPAFSSGKFYMAIKLNDNHSMGTSDYLGIDLLNGAGVTGFFGKASGVADRRLSVAHNGATRTNRLDGSNSGYQLNASTDYLIVMKYDFNTKELDAVAYISSNLAHADPDLELGWAVQMTNVHISRIDGIRLVASDNNQIVTFDSIRIGPSWEEVMWDLPDNWHEDNGPVPTLVYIGTNYGPSVYGQVITNLSDAELKSSQLIDFAVRWDSPSGIFITNATATNLNIGSPNARVNPNWDPLAVGVASNLFNLDRFFTNFFGYNGATVVTTYQKNGFSVTNIDFSLQYFVTVSAETFPGGTTVSAPNGASWDAVPVTRALTVNEPLRFYVYDDDTNAPALGARPLRVFTNATIASAQDAGGGLERYFVYDGILTQSGMRVQLNTYDTYSGLQRSSSGSAASNLNVTIPFVVTNDNASYDAALSSADSTVAASTSTWAFASSLFTWDRVSSMWGGDGTALQGQDVEVRANLPDADEDRLDDQMWASNTVMGYIRLLDDDITAPNTPEINFAGSAARPFFMNTNGFAIGSGDTEIRNTYARRSGTGSNSVFAITDEELAQAGSRQLQFVFGALDADSGVRRGASGNTNTIMSFSLGDGILSGVVTGWNAATSTTVNAPGVVQTNVWMFTNGFFTETIITQLLAVTGSSGSGSNRVAVTIPDADDDRTNDTATLHSRTVGWLQVFDDDINGPVMSVADVVEASGGAAILSTSFETNQMWPVPSTSSTITWTNTDSYGAWILQGVTHTSLDPKNTGTRRLGMLTNTFAQPYFQLPPVSNPGRVTLYAARVSGGSGTPVLRLEWRNGASWDSLGNNNVTNTVYEPLTWDFELLSAGVTLRVVRVDTGTSRSQVYVDDVSINSALEWIGTNVVSNAQIRINWTPAVDDFSGIEDYHIVPPAINSIAPTTTNDGNPISAAFTTTVQSIAGQQGVITGYLFAVDDDSDRSNDRTMGNVLPVLVKVDTNPPPAVLNVTNITTDTAVDETSELKFQWTPFSTNMHAAAGWRQSDSEPLSHWDTYYITVHELDGSFNEVSTNVYTATNGPANLATNVTTSIVVSNLTFDTHYRIRVAGRDRAGNIGPAMISTGLTVNFQVTQGLARTTTEITNGIRLAWIASSNRVYDQLYVDATSFRDTLSNQWDWVDRITNNVAEGNTLTDVGGDNPTNRYRVPPASLNNTMRFYRVSLQDAWQPSNTLRRGSREVYVTKPLSLVTGENWYSVFFAPDTATVSYVFGTNRLWGGSSYAQATKIHWFSPTNAGSSYNYATNTIWLAGTNGFGGTWTYQVGGVGNANNMVFPTHQGFMIEVPPGSPNISLPIVGQVMTQQTTTVIGGGSSTTNTYHIVSWRYPTRVSLTGALFRGSGMVGNNVSVLADEVRILRNNGNGSLEQPEARWRLRSDQTTWQLISYNTNVYAAPGPDVNSFFIEPDDAVIIVRKNPGTMTWTNRVYYSPPGKNFNP